jgi:hypothetical protein
MTPSERELADLVTSIRLTLRKIEDINQAEISKLQKQLQELLAALKNHGDTSFFQDIAKFIVGYDSGAGRTPTPVEATLKTYGTILGQLVSTVIDTVVNRQPSLERRVLDTKIVKAPDGKCYRVVWYQTKTLGSPTWSDVQTEVEEVPCP